MTVESHLICLSIAIASALLCGPGASGQEAKTLGEGTRTPPHWLVSEKITKSLATEDLHELVVLRDNDLAIHAAWRRVEERLLSRKSSTPPPRVEQTPQYFIGFLEGRLAVHAPPHWKDALQSARGGEDRRVVFELPRIDKSRDRIDGLVPTAGGPVRVDDDGNLRVDLPERKVVIPKQIKDVSKSRSGAIGFALAADKEATYVAWYSSHANVVVTCIRDGTELWSVAVNGNWYSGDASGPGAGQSVELVLSEDEVALFCAAPSVIYMEVLGKRTGASRARFSTSAYHLEE